MRPAARPKRSPDKLAFFQGIAEKLEAYVYLLIDPRDGETFYVGKGRGDRAWQHARGKGRGTPKLDRIRAIQRRGGQVRIEVLRHRMTDDVALAVEAAAIDLLRLEGHELTNLVAGRDTRGCGWMSLDSLRARYGAEPAQIHPGDRVLLIRINKAFRPGMSDSELYEATRQWWRMDPFKNQPTVALAVYDGVVRRTYRVNPYGWKPRKRDGRWSFSGTPTPALSARYEWRDVSSFVAAGAQNPISYVNCGPEPTADGKDGRWRFIGRPADDKGAAYEGMNVAAYWRPGAQNPVSYVSCSRL